MPGEGSLAGCENDVGGWMLELPPALQRPRRSRQGPIHVPLGLLASCCPLSDPRQLPTCLHGQSEPGESVCPCISL